MHRPVDRLRDRVATELQTPFGRSFGLRERAFLAAAVCGGLAFAVGSALGYGNARERLGYPGQYLMTLWSLMFTSAALIAMRTLPLPQDSPRYRRRRRLMGVILVAMFGVWGGMMLSILRA